MSLKEFRAAGDSTFFPLEWTNADGTPVDLSTFSSIVLQIERQGLALLELPVAVDDAPNGLGHFEPTPAQMIEGTHFYRVKGVVAATGEVKPLPPEDPVNLVISRALVDLN